MDFANYFLNSIFGESNIHWANEVDSNALPPPKRALEWYEDTEKRNIVNAIFFGLGSLSAGAAVFTAVYLTATLTAALITASLALAATALVVAAIYLYTMEPSALDPVYRMEKRQELLSQPETPPFSALNSALNGDILTRYEIQGALRHDINGMDFDAFIQKHGIEGLRFLDFQNKSLLRPKYVGYLLQKNMGEVELGDTLFSEEAKIFNLGVEELTSSPKDENQSSIAQTMSSYATSAMSFAKEKGPGIALKAVESVVPTQLKNAAHCASASITYATQGEYTKSANAAFGAVTFATVYTMDEMLKAENPEVYKMADQIIDYEKLNTIIVK